MPTAARTVALLCSGVGVATGATGRENKCGHPISGQGNYSKLTCTHAECSGSMLGVGDAALKEARPFPLWWLQSSVETERLLQFYNFRIGSGKFSVP